MEMYKFNIKLKNKFIAFFILCAFTGCYRINHTTTLELKDGSNVILYQQDSAWIQIFGNMKEWNNFIIFPNDNYLGDSNYIKLEFVVRYFDSVRINSFSCKLFYVKKNHSTQISEGRIYYDPDFCYFDDYHQYQDIKDTFIDYKIVNPSYNWGTLMVVKSKPSVEIENADKFILDMSLDCKVNEEEITINRIDTLYRRTEKMRGISVH